MTNYAAKTDKGKRYDHNEDFYILPEPDEKYGITEDKLKKAHQLFILADGMGGASSGEVASQLTAGWLARQYYSESDVDSIDKLKTIISDVNAEIYNLSKEHEQYDGMCTTLVAAMKLDKKILICSVGDSRAYILQNNKLTQITEDQSEVWEIYKAGGITKNEISSHPRSNVLRKAIGGESVLESDDINSYEISINSGDQILLCSDGLSDMVADSGIEEIMAEAASFEQAAVKLIQTANENGGRDNITAVVFG